MSTYILLKDWDAPQFSIAKGQRFTKVGNTVDGAYHNQLGNIILHPIYVEDNPDWFKKEEKSLKEKIAEVIEKYRNDHTMTSYRIASTIVNDNFQPPYLKKWYSVEELRERERIAFHSGRSQKMYLDGSLRPVFHTFEDYLKTIKP